MSLKKSKGINIEAGRYWDEGVKLISGCTRCSDGCKNCWSLAMDKRFSPSVDENLIVTHPERLTRFNARKPKVFAIWNDLFHEDVPDKFIKSVYSSIYQNQKNTYLILTKRHKRIANFAEYNIPHVMTKLNVWHGLTVCDQEEADEKIPIFLQVPGKKFLSIEPCISEIKLGGFDGVTYRPWLDSKAWTVLINAVILGGETGPGARPLHPDWVRSVRDQCQSAGVDFFFKQWGEYIPMNERNYKLSTHDNTVAWAHGDWNKGRYASLRDTRGNDVVNMIKVGRKKAGRELDGRTHDELPWVE